MTPALQIYVHMKSVVGCKILGNPGHHRGTKASNKYNRVPNNRLMEHRTYV